MRHSYITNVRVTRLSHSYISDLFYFFLFICGDLDDIVCFTVKCLEVGIWLKVEFLSLNFHLILYLNVLYSVLEDCNLQMPAEMSGSQAVLPTHNNTMCHCTLCLAVICFYYNTQKNPLAKDAKSFNL